MSKQRLIDANALKEQFADIRPDFPKFHQYSFVSTEEIARKIDSATTIKTFTLLDIEEQYRKGLEKGLSEWETERPRGEWVDGTQGYYCSKCNELDNFYFEHNFCPKCGADMRGTEK